MESQKKPLNLLIVEDSTDDLMLLLTTLRRSGFDVRFEQVEDPVRFEVALDKAKWDAIVSDFNMPHFSGPEALRITRSRDMDIPFLMVSGTIGEERAVEVVKAGANDYVMKENLLRLPTVIERELREARHRRERREAEATAMRLLLAIQQANEGIAIINSKWILEYTNPVFTEMTGLSTEHSGGIREILLGNDEERIAAVNRALQTCASWSDRYEAHRPDGSEYTLDLKIHPSANCKRDQSSMVLIARDVSMEAKLESQLNQAQRLEALGTLAGGIAHDFNNILTAMVGYTELVRTSFMDNPEISSDLGKVLRAGERAKRLIRQILTISRQQDEQRLRFYPQMVVQEAIDFLRATLPTNIELRKNISEECPMISADPTRLNHVVMNLCTNASHAMGTKHGPIDIDLESVHLQENNTQVPFSFTPGIYVRLRVRDCGHGMDDETMKRIFDPFFTTKKVGEGTGLGLATVHSIVTEWGGAITVDSDIGIGTTFEVYIPSCEQIESIEAAEQEEPLEGGEHILVVDDEEVILELMTRSLSRLKYRVTAVNSAVEAKKMVEADPNSFDLVITDQSMPTMTGDELAQDLRALRPGLPILLTTGDLGISRRLIMNKSEFDGFVPKPIDFNSLGRTIRQLMNERQSEEQAAAS